MCTICGVLWHFTLFSSKFIFLRFTLFYCKISFVSIYALLCGKILPKNCARERKMTNTRYVLALVLRLVWRVLALDTKY